MQMDMTITTTYKLLSIKNNVGDFDVSQVVTMNTSATQFPMNAYRQEKENYFMIQSTTST